MTEAKPTRVKSRGRIFPEIQWTKEQLAQWRSEREEFYRVQLYQSPLELHCGNAILSCCIKFTHPVQAPLMMR